MDKVTVLYQVTASGPAAATVANAISPAQIPLPVETLLQMGLRVESDTYGVVGTANRTTVLDFGPSAAGTATAVMSADGRTVKSVTVTPGLDYVVPPVVSFSAPPPQKTPPQPPFPGSQAIPNPRLARGRAYLNAQSIENLAGGANYNNGTTTVAFVGGFPPALFLGPQSGKSIAQLVPPNAPAPNNRFGYCVQQISIAKQGRGYGATTQVQILGGGQSNGGIQAQAIVSQFGPNGEIEVVTVINSGSLYATAPEIAFYDPAAPGTQANAGTKAVACALMGAGKPALGTVTVVAGLVTVIAITDPGEGYIQAPTVVVTDTGVVPGTGAGATVGMGVGTVIVTDPGQGYTPGTPPTVTLTPFFKSMFPDSSDQRVPFYFFPLTNQIKQALPTQVVSVVPVLS